jgi:hypothetical protein
VLGVLGVLALLTGLVLQRALHLPLAYDWGFPYRVLWNDVLASAGFPCALLLVALLGWHSAGISVRASIPAERRARLLLGLVGVVTSSLDCLLFERHAPWDWAAAGLVAGLVAARAREMDRPAALRCIGSLAYGAGVFAAVCFFYTVVKAAVFRYGVPHDASLIALEARLFGVVPHRVVAAFAATRPTLVACCDWTYFRLFDHMLLTGMLLLTRRDAQERIEYLAALTICYLLGAPLYHLYPAWGPGYFEPAHFAYLNDPRLTTSGIRIWLWNNTHDVARGTAKQLVTWSYVSCLPSLHVAHEVVMAFYARRPLPALVVSVAFTAATLVSVVVLGWHYPIDWLAGAALGAVSIGAARRLRGLSWPVTLRPSAAKAR